MKRAPAVGILLALGTTLWGCSTTETETRVDSVFVELTGLSSRVVDPKLEGDVSTTLSVSVRELPEGDTCALEMRAVHISGAEEVWSLGSVVAGQELATEWDGYQDEGLPFDPGPVRLIATVGCERGAVGSDAETVWVARLGVVTLDFQGPPDEEALVPLAFHRRSLVEPGISIIDDTIPEYRSTVAREGVAELDEVNGEARGAVGPWLDTATPPWGPGGEGESVHNIPAGYVAGSQGIVEARFGQTALSPSRGTIVSAFGPEPSWGGPPIRVRVDGLESIDAGALITDEPVQRFRFDVPGMMGRHELSLRWTYQFQEGERWFDIPGSHTTEHHIYTFAAPPPLRDGTELGMAPAVPWISALAQLDPAIRGLPPEVAPLLDAIRDYLHLNRYVIYNPSDRAYSRYDGRYIFWNYAWSELSDWLARDDGIELYCHSMSCLLSVLAGMVGVGAPQQVLGVGFQTGLTRAAGTDGWRTWRFNSHSFVSPDDGATFWDASIDLDGDDDPGREPVTPLAAKGLSRAEYLSRLVVSGDVDIVNSGYCYFR